MNTHAAPGHPAPDTTLTDEDIRTCVRVLRSIEADRSHLARLSQEQRRELLMLAGLYRAVSYLVNACGVQREAFAPEFPVVA